MKALPQIRAYVGMGRDHDHPHVVGVVGTLRGRLASKFLLGVYLLMANAVRRDCLASSLCIKDCSYGSTKVAQLVGEIHRYCKELGVPLPVRYRPLRMGAFPTNAHDMRAAVDSVASRGGDHFEFRP